MSSDPVHSRVPRPALASTPVVVITGASRGIGLAFVQSYVKAGNTVIAIVRQTTEALSALLPAEHIVEGVDLADTDAPSKVLASLGATPVSILINNAGVLGKEKFTELAGATKSLLDSFQVNVVAPLLLTQALVTNGNLTAGSKVVFMSSQAASIGGMLGMSPDFAVYPYRISKAGLNMAAKVLSEDLKDTGIAVVTLHPGMVDTDMLEQFFALAPPSGSGEAAAPPPATSPAECVSSLVSIIHKLNMESTGQFLAKDGSVVPY